MIALILIHLIFILPAESIFYVNNFFQSAINNRQLWGNFHPSGGEKTDIQPTTIDNYSKFFSIRKIIFFYEYFLKRIAILKGVRELHFSIERALIIQKISLK